MDFASHEVAKNTSSSSSSSQQDQRKIFGAFMDNHPSTQTPMQQQNHHQTMLSFGMMMQSSSPLPSEPFNINKDGGAYDLGELDQALFQYLDVQDPSPQQRQNCGMRPHTLNIFPSQPMHVEPSETSSKGNGGLVYASGSKISTSDPSMGLPQQKNDGSSASLEPAKVVKREGYRKGPTSSSEHETKSPHDPKTLRRLAQNREAARKSRLRKKAYVQQLESSRMRLAHLEQEMQRARSQGLYLGAGSSVISSDPSLSVAMMANINNASSDAALFDMEYSRWVEENNHHTVELRRALDDHSPDHELRILVDNQLAHYDQLTNLKSMMLKSDVFHIFSGMWKTPAERCFLWIGGFRPSHIIKMLSSQIEAMSDQQLMGLYALQQSTQEAEEALSQGIEALNQSITETLAANSDTITAHMALAINKLSAIEGFIRQADNLRQQSLHRVRQILSSRQSARCFLAIAEYFHRLRALSALWLGRSHQE